MTPGLSLVLTSLLASTHGLDISASSPERMHHGNVSIVPCSPISSYRSHFPLSILTSGSLSKILCQIKLEKQGHT